LGLEGKFSLGRMVPLTVRVPPMEAKPAELLVRQKLGNPLRGSATVDFNFSLRETERNSEGVFELTLPIYDLAQPLEIRLRDEQGKIQLSKEVPLEEGWSQSPFSLAVGDFPLSLGEGFRRLSREQMPLSWSSYDSVSNLWLGRIPGGLSQQKWEALGEWVLGGGVLLIFSGSDVYNLDSPGFRRLSPLSSFRLVEGSGETYLTGVEKDGTELVMEQGGTPLLFKRRYGTGSVFLVTEGVDGIREKEWEQLLETVPSSGSLSLQEEATSLLNDTVVNRPSRLLAFLLIGAVLGLFALIVNRVNRARLRLYLLLGSGMVLILFSTFYIGQEETVNNIYLARTELNMRDARSDWGFGSSWLSFLGANVPGGVTFELERGGDLPPLVQMPQKLKEGRYGYNWKEGQGLTLTPSGLKREVRTFPQREEGSLLVSSNGDEKLEVINELGAELDQGVFLTPEGTYPLEGIGRGTNTHYLRSPVSEREIKRWLKEEFVPSYEKMEKSVPLEGRSWFLGFRKEDQLEKNSGVRTRKRTVKLYVIQA